MDLYEIFLTNKARDLFEGDILTEISVKPPANRIKAKPAVSQSMTQQNQAGVNYQKQVQQGVAKKQAAGVAQAQAGQQQAGRNYQKGATASTSQGTPQSNSFKDKWAAMKPEEQNQLIPKYAEAIKNWIEQDPALKPTVLSILQTAIAQK